MGIAALILGIIGIIVPGFGIPFALLALILGIVALVKKKQKGLALTGVILGGIGIILGPILMAVAIPAFVRYQNGAKAAEVNLNLERIYSGAVMYYETPRLGPNGQPLPNQLPPSSSWTPAVPCCQQTGGRCSAAANQAAWQQPQWQALEFAPFDDFYYQYQVVSQGERLLIQAQGDLDCDGAMSNFTLEANVRGTPPELERDVGIVEVEPFE